MRVNSLNSLQFLNAPISIFVVPSGMIHTPFFISYFAIGQYCDFLNIVRF